MFGKDIQNEQHLVKCVKVCMLSARQSYHYTPGMLACSSGSALDGVHKQFLASTMPCSHKGASIRSVTPVLMRPVQVWAGNTFSPPPARLKRKKERSDTITILREGESTVS